MGRRSILASMLLLAACDSGVKPEAPDPAQSQQAMKARIDTLSDGRRNAVMLRAVRDAGQPCQNVIGSAYNGVHFSRPSWVARCADGKDWLVMLDAGGRALVAAREEAVSER